MVPSGVVAALVRRRPNGVRASNFGRKRWVLDLSLSAESGSGLVGRLSGCFCLRVVVGDAGLVARMVLGLSSVRSFGLDERVPKVS